MVKLLGKIWVFVLVATSLLPLPALAGSPNLKTPYTEAQLVSEVQSIQAGKPFTLMIHFKVLPGWHTYWINPGDSGEPLKVQWDFSPKLRVGPLQFPYPQRIEMPPLVNYGFEGEVMFLVEVIPPLNLTPGEEVHLEAKATWLVCKEICLPQLGTLTLDLAVQDREPLLRVKWKKKFEQARKKIPLAAPPDSVRLARTSGQLILEWEPGQLIGSAKKTGWTFFPLRPGKIENAAPQKVTTSGNQIRMVLEKSPLLTQETEKLQGVLVSGNQSFLVSAQETARSWNLSLLFFAFLGGVLLNLMPCVFPVLSIKVLSFVHQGGKAAAKIRRHGWAYTLGVLLSFWLLGAFLFLFRFGGEKLGWGFQLQSPVFNLILAYGIFLMALSLWDLFPVGTSLLGWGNRFTQRSDYLGSFLTGILATLVATPCIGPFLGPAIGLALTQPNLLSWAIFSAVGMGLALPYLLFAYFPQGLRLLPKAGPWLETFKQAMAFPLLATVLWLFWVFSYQTQTQSLVYFLGGLLVLALGTWIASKIEVDAFRKLARYWQGGLVLITLILGTALGLSGIQAPHSAAPFSGNEVAGKGLVWLPFSQEKLNQLRQEGKPVFLNFTATWCITCQVNERLVFRSPDIKKRFEELGIVALKADWTHKDNTIAEALAAYGRQGVPLYVFYGAESGGSPKILPEVLTKNIVIKAIDTGGST